MNIAIFGAGIAGLMTAITLRAHGHSCHIYERLRPSHETGMGFILMPEGIDCLRRFGVHLTGEFNGVPLEHYYYRNPAGQILHERPIPSGARSLRRRDLIAALIQTLPTNSTVAFDAELDELEFDERGWVTAARLTSGARIQADLYVAADGIRSRARQALFPDWPAAPARVHEVVGLARCENTMRWADHNINKFHATDGGIALGVLPVADDCLVWYLQFDTRRFPPPQETAEARHTFVRELVGDWAEPIPHLMAMTDFSRVHLWRPMDSDLIPHFSQGNLVLVGDAAHPLLPFTSQGVTSAIADAVSLSGALNGKGMNSESEVEAALARYSSERREQCAPYIAKGRELAQHFLAPQTADSALLPVA
jgi:2-polyprenyl-6-methoxyphenol hydroxylase-like FAD-dependent oxidoreductase